MSKANIRKFNSKSSVLQSPHIDVIMDKYDKFGSSMPVMTFWRDYVAPIDPKIGYMTWKRFINTIHKAVITKTDNIMTKIIDKKVKESEMEKNSISNILAISEATLDQLIKEPELLNKVPITERMSWLFRAMSARDSRMVAMTKVQAEKRKTSMYEDMMQAAQYGEIDENEFNNNLLEEPDEEYEEENFIIDTKQTSNVKINND